MIHVMASFPRTRMCGQEGPRVEYGGKSGWRSNNSDMVRCDWRTGNGEGNDPRSETDFRQPD